jgi:hypothetical protein
MTEPLSKEETLAVVRPTYQEVIDTLLFMSDEMEMQWLPTKDGGRRASTGRESLRVVQAIDLRSEGDGSSAIKTVGNARGHADQDEREAGKGGR